MSSFPFLLFFLAAPSAPAPLSQAVACFPLQAAQGEPDGWLLLAALVVCTAGRLATQGFKR